MKNLIGKKVYELVATKYTCTIDTNKIYEIVKVLNYNETNDYCRHYILKGENGEEKEVREFYVVVVPDYSLDEDYMIAKYLSDNELCAEVYPECEGKVIAVDISWGDWKHEHGWCKNLMGYLGYTEMGCRVTEENGSDCYSATHYFYKVA